MEHKLTIDNPAFPIEGKRVLIRVDFNVPQDKKTNEISDDTRIRETLPTLKFLLEKKPKTIVIMSHLGRPDGKIVPKMTLAPVAKRLEQLLGHPVIFMKDCVGEEVEKECLADCEPTKVILLENLRFHLEEEGKGFDEAGNATKASKEDIKKFRDSLTKLGDVYVNDAFGTCHRAHSSISGIGLSHRAAGFLMGKELKYFGKALQGADKPLIILGGAKVSDKIQLIKNLLDKASEMLIVGGMAYTFLKVHFGMKIGKSIFDEAGSKIVEELFEKANKNGVKLHFPIDFVCANQYAEFPTCITTKTREEGIPDDMEGLDIGPQTRKLFAEVIGRAKVIVWNGPAGVFEFKNFSHGSYAILDAVVDATTKGAISVIGGGDTASMAQKSGKGSQISHISTGGGASMELLEGKEMPGITSLSDK